MHGEGLTKPKQHPVPCPQWLESPGYCPCGPRCCLGHQPRPQAEEGHEEADYHSTERVCKLPKVTQPERRSPGTNPRLTDPIAASLIYLFLTLMALSSIHPPLACCFITLNDLT